MTRRVSRRDFLKYMGAVAGAGIASACVPPAAPATLAPGPTLGATSRPTWTPPALCATPTPMPVPPPRPVRTNFDVYSIYIDFRDLPEIPRNVTGYETVVPLYGHRQDPVTMRMDIKWARESGVATFIFPNSRGQDTRLKDWFLPASEPPFEIDFATMFNPEFESLDTSDPSQVSIIESRARDVREFLATSIQHPRYKRLPDGRPVVFYFLAQVVAYWFGVDKLEETVQLLRENLAEDIFIVGDVMIDPYQVRTAGSQHQGDYIRRQVQAFDGIFSYYIPTAGFEYHSDYEWNHVVTPFKDMIKGYAEAFDYWSAKAHEYGVKLVPAPAPTGMSTRLLYEAGLDTSLVDRHDGVSYGTSKEMVELGAKYADPDLKMVVISCWNELSEGAAIVPSVGYRFNPAHAVRDTLAIEPAGGWPQDYYPPP
jgi:hypothetical protein